MRSAWLASLAALLLIGACGSGETTIGVGDDMNAGRGSRNDDEERDAGDSGMSEDPRMNEGDAAVSDDAGAVDPRAPRIEILNPTPASDPNADDVLIEPSVRVRCRVTKSPVAAARDVNQSSVKIRLTASGNPNQEPLQGVVTALPDNEFEAEFNLAELPNGPIAFECSAADVGMPALTGTAVVETLLDLGPSIVILEPVDEGTYALMNEVLVKFQVNPSPLTDDDAEADVAGLRLDIIDQEFVATEDPAQAGLYTISINFDDRTLFPMPPTAAEIVVSATSSRTPAAPRRETRASITIDADGPEIEIASPKHLQIVRGLVELVVSIGDPSGVQTDSVIGSINNGQYVLDEWEISGTTYRHRFDTRDDIFTSQTQLTINIFAMDTVGNENSIDRVLRLDNVPPVLSLDPPDIREYTVKNDGTVVCSLNFDPVGDDAAGDLSDVLASSLYRVLVDERTNYSPGAVTRWHAGVDPTSMRLFAQGKDEIALLLDTDGDGMCDTINSSDDMDMADRPVELTLTAVNDRGSSYFSTAPNFDSPRHMASDDCTAGTSTNPPNPLCPGTPLTRSLPQTLEGDPPALYAFAPQSNMSTCAGDSWELLPSVGEGWACLAARVADNIGNIGVSPPIRVCIDDLLGAPPPCLDPLANPPPTCTDGCGSIEFAPNQEWLVQ